MGMKRRKVCVGEAEDEEMEALRETWKEKEKETSRREKIQLPKPHNLNF